MAWLPESSLLACSVFGYIQVWDMSNYTCVSIIGGYSDFDSPDLIFRRFDVSGKALFRVIGNDQVNF